MTKEAPGLVGVASRFFWGIELSSALCLGALLPLVLTGLLSTCEYVACLPEVQK